MEPAFFYLLKNRQIFKQIRKLLIKKDTWSGFFFAYECFIRHRIQIIRNSLQSKLHNISVPNGFLSYLKPEILSVNHWDKLENLLLQRINPTYAANFDFTGMTAKIYFAVEFRIMHIILKTIEAAMILPASEARWEIFTDFNYNYVFLNPNYQIRYSYLDIPSKLYNVRDLTIEYIADSKYLYTFSRLGMLSTKTSGERESFKVLFETISRWVFGKNRLNAQLIPLIFAKNAILKYDENSNACSFETLCFDLCKSLRAGIVIEMEFSINSKFNNLREHDIYKMIYG